MNKYSVWRWSPVAAWAFAVLPSVLVPSLAWSADAAACFGNSRGNSTETATVGEIASRWPLPARTVILLAIQTCSGAF